MNNNKQYINTSTQAQTLEERVKKLENIIAGLLALPEGNKTNTTLTSHTPLQTLISQLGISQKTHKYINNTPNHTNTTNNYFSNNNIANTGHYPSETQIISELASAILKANRRNL